MCVLSVRYLKEDGGHHAGERCDLWRDAFEKIFKMLWGTVIMLVLGLTGTIVGGRHRRRDLRARRNIIADKCSYPCTCPTKDICDECEECPRQLREPCSEDRPCDQMKGLTCVYLHEGETEGICRESPGVPCIVHNRTYQHGETFSPDCRTQCACQNGTYGCSSLCPQEHISPKGTCRHPRLVEVPGQCCREWMCDSQAVEQPPSCQPSFTKWSDCSSNCGAGLSKRRSNLNGRCEPTIETRICQTRRCDNNIPMDRERARHHLRRGHECKATHRLSNGVHLRFGPCISRKRYRPKFCGTCPIPGIICQPLLSTTVKVDFLCEAPPGTETPQDLLPDYLEPGEDLWADDHPYKLDYTLQTLTISVQWVLKCSCDAEVESSSSSSSGDVVILHRVHRTASP